MSQLKRLPSWLRKVSPPPPWLKPRLKQLNPNEPDSDQVLFTSEKYKSIPQWLHIRLENNVPEWVQNLDTIPFPLLYDFISTDIPPPPPPSSPSSSLSSSSTSSIPSKSSTTMAASPITFSILFDKSKFATLHPNQVITTHERHRYLGQWGLKHNLPPPPLHTPRYITIHHHDSSHGLKIEAATSQVSMSNLWKENFPVNFSNFTPKDADPLSRQDRFSDLNQKEWEALLEKARKIVKEKEKQQLSNMEEEGQKPMNKLFTSSSSSSSPFKLSNLSNNSSFPSSAISAIFSAHSSNNSFSSSSPSLSSSSSSSASTVSPKAHSGIYSDYNPGPILVRGRFLGTVTGGYAIATSGIIAFLPSNEIPSIIIGQTPSRLYKFYVMMARWHNGKPEVVLTMKKPTLGSNLIRERSQSQFKGLVPEKWLDSFMKPRKETTDMIQDESSKLYDTIGSHIVTSERSSNSEIKNE